MRAVNADENEVERYSFVVKIWVEEVNDSTQQIKWRGHITHVATGTRRYVERLQDITAFIQAYLSEWEQSSRSEGRV